MRKEDLELFARDERRVLVESFYPQVTKRRARTIVLSSAVILLGVGLFVAFGVGVILLAGITVATVLVSAFEKLSYTEAMVHREALVRKLVHRLEDVEGLPRSPVGREQRAPSQEARLDELFGFVTPDSDPSGHSPAADRAKRAGGFGYDSSWSDDSRIVQHSLGDRESAPASKPLEQVPTRTADTRR